jgi:site-specific DNA-methyltransferase (adenine-specific)
MLTEGEQYNPDVLSCIANLSSDEVFTPPEVADQMLDLLPDDLWFDKNATFLDPGCKSGVFPREIAKRLDVGLEDEIPDRQERLNHIFKNQLFAIAITELTALISRRSVYCSKSANGEYSVCEGFDDADGNIRFEPTGHTWNNNGRCEYCGASRGDYQRDDSLEAHAYELIHSEAPEAIFNMKFDVIISNPPYQLSDSGAFASASPIYHKFVEQAKKLNPRYLAMVIPARWYAGGKGLTQFRRSMLEDRRLRILHDYPIAADCFPGLRIAGGVCYFRWDNDDEGDCHVFTHKDGLISSDMERPLLENGADTFIRNNRAVSIFRKVALKHEEPFSNIVSARKPFGLPTDFLKKPQKYNKPQISDHYIDDGLKIYGTLNYKSVKKYVDANYPIDNGIEHIDNYKVFVSQVLDNGFDTTKERLKPFIGEPKDICTETFLCVGCYADKEKSENVVSYMNTKFFHFLMFLRKVSHHVTANVYSYVPLQDFNESWSDEKLYQKYGLTNDEIAAIEDSVMSLGS